MGGGEGRWRRERADCEPHCHPRRAPRPAFYSKMWPTRAGRALLQTPSSARDASEAPYESRGSRKEPSCVHPSAWQRIRPPALRWLPAAVHPVTAGTPGRGQRSRRAHRSASSSAWPTRVTYARPARAGYVLCTPRPGARAAAVSPGPESWSSSPGVRASRRLARVPVR